MSKVFKKNQGCVISFWNSSFKNLDDLKQEGKDKLQEIFNALNEQNRCLSTYLKNATIYKRLRLLLATGNQLTSAMIEDNGETHFKYTEEEARTYVKEITEYYKCVQGFADTIDEEKVMIRRASDQCNANEGVKERKSNMRQNCHCAQAQKIIDGTVAAKDLMLDYNIVKNMDMTQLAALVTTMGGDFNPTASGDSGGERRLQDLNSLTGGTGLDLASIKAMVAGGTDALKNIDPKILQTVLSNETLKDQLDPEIIAQLQSIAGELPNSTNTKQTTITPNKKGEINCWGLRPNADVVEKICDFTTEQLTTLKTKLDEAVLPARNLQNSSGGLDLSKILTGDESFDKIAMLFNDDTVHTVTEKMISSHGLKLAEFEKMFGKDYKFNPSCLGALIKSCGKKGLFQQVLAMEKRKTIPVDCDYSAQNLAIDDRGFITRCIRFFDYYFLANSVSFRADRICGLNQKYENPVTTGTLGTRLLQTYDPLYASNESDPTADATIQTDQPEYQPNNSEVTIDSSNPDSTPDEEQEVNNVELQAVTDPELIAAQSDLSLDTAAIVAEVSINDISSSWLVSGFAAVMMLLMILF
jgi:hypothetical protein